MSMQVKMISWALSVAMVFAVLFGAYEYGRHAEGLERDNEQLTERLEYADAFNKAQTKNDDLKTKGAEQHAQDTATTNRVRDEFAAFRLRVPKPTACTGVSNPPSGSADNSTGTGISPDPEQEAFDRFTDGLKQDAYRLDTVIESCREVMSWAKNLCKINDTCKGDK